MNLKKLWKKCVLIFHIKRYSLENKGDEFMEQELIDRTVLLAEIEHGDNKPTIYDRSDFADWILECIKKAPVVCEKREIQSGQKVYVITKKNFRTYEEMMKNSSKSYEMIECYVFKTINRSNDIPKYRVSGYYANGNYYKSTITENAIGITLFINKNEAEEALKKKNRKV